MQLKALISCLVTLFLSVQFNTSATNEYKAVVIVPVADAAGGPLSDVYKQGSIESHYQEFPYAPDKGYHACLRMHQLKYNEIVTVKPSVKEAGESECWVSNLFYLDHLGRKRKRFWTLKKNLLPLSSIEKKIIPFIPQPIDQEKKPADYNQNILSLVMPWCDEKSGTWYSAGTRFVRCDEKDTAKSYAFYFIDYATLSVKIRYTTKKNAVVDYPKTPEKMRDRFLKILKSWVRTSQGFIPYVFGGVSFTKRCKRDEFSLIFTKRASRKISFWQRPLDTCYQQERLIRHGFRRNDLRAENLAHQPLTGFDCSGMLLTAAQIAGIPYYLKNTYTITKQCGYPLKKNEKLEPGDLLWYSGHVMVVSDIKKNLLIEAIGYEAGYGKVQEINIAQAFLGIKNYDELLDAYHKKHSLKRLNSQGKPYRSVHKVIILRLI